MIQKVNHHEMLHVLLEHLSQARGLPVTADERLGSLGFDSMTISQLILKLERSLARSLEPILFWEFPTGRLLAQHLAGLQDQATMDSSNTLGRYVPEPVAITGLACRFPGAPDVHAYWQLMKEGNQAIQPLHGRHFVEHSHSPWHIPSGEVGGFLAEVSEFDHEKFGINHHEATQMDPQQRVLLEVVWTALEQAGMDPLSLQGQRGAVYVGAMWSDFSHHITPERMTAHSATGLDTSILSARLSFIFGLNGPSLTVNTACSSSLVALHLACQAIRQDECDFAVVAGVNLMLATQSLEAMKRFGGLSETGLCHTFDKNADGYVRAEGCACVILKPLIQALSEPLPIWGVIRASVVNNNGYHGSLTAPSVRAQEQLLKKACHLAGVEPKDVQYVEAHGTGTAMGDPIETKALAAAYCEDSGREQALMIGSVKTNIGHCEAVAGLAGLIKVLLAFHHRMIPAHLNYQTANPAIDWASLGLKLVTENQPWLEPERMAGVSSFGFGGTNAHVIVSEYWPHPTPAACMPPSLFLKQGQPHPAGRTSLWLFSGQGSHWQGMGRAYARLDPVFRIIVARCDAWIRKLAGWSMAQKLYDDSAFTDVRTAWPCHVVLQLALAETWLAKGLQPSGVMGHSIGEVAAAHFSGLISLEDAMRTVLQQAHWAAQRPGGMAVLHLGWADAQHFLEQADSSLCCAIQHSSQATVISGSHEELKRMQNHCLRAGLTLTPIKSQVCVHCGLDETENLDTFGWEVTSHPPRFPFFSAIKVGRALTSLPKHYGLHAIAQPLLWFDALQQVLQQLPVDMMLEIAPHPILTHSMLELGSLQGREVEVVSSGHREGINPVAMDEVAQYYGDTPPRSDPWSGYQALLLSGHSIHALKRRCLSITRWLMSNETAPSLQECAEALTSCAAYERYRITCVVSSRVQAIQQLQKYAASEDLHVGDAHQKNICVLMLQDVPPFSTEHMMWLGQFSSFANTYAHIMSQGSAMNAPAQERLEAAAQQLACLDLLGDMGIVFERYQGIGHGVLLLPYLEKCQSLQGMIQALAMWDGTLSDRTCANQAEMVHRHTDHVCISMNFDHDTQCKTSQHRTSPAQDFLNFLACCYSHGIGGRVDFYPGQVRRLLSLPVCLSSLDPSHTDDINASVQIYRLAWLPTATPSFARSKPCRPLVFSSGALQAQLQAHPDFEQATWVVVKAHTLLDRQEIHKVFEGKNFDAVICIWYGPDGVENTKASEAEHGPWVNAWLLLQHIQAMTSSRPAVYFFTMGCQQPGDTLGPNPWPMLWWGLVRTVQGECAGLHCTIADLDPPLTTGLLSAWAVQGLLTSLQLKLGQMVWREGQVFVPHMLMETVQHPTPHTPTFQEQHDGFCLITGGLGALALAWIAQQLDRGWTRFLLVGRQAPGASTNQRLEHLRALGASIVVSRGDVTNLSALEKMVQMASVTLGPLQGIVHAAGVLATGPIASTDREEVERVLAPKVKGALHLHMLSKQWPIQQFVLVSSVSSVLGFPQHAAYAMANAFLDGLASYRQNKGLPALSIGFGPFQEQGLLARTHAHLEFAWLPNMSISEAILSAQSLLQTEGHRLVMHYTGPMSLEQNRQQSPSHLQAMVDFGSIPEQERADFIRTWITQCVAELLALPDGYNIQPHIPLSDLGMHSLLSVELRNRLQDAFSVRFSVAALWDYPSISDLSTYLLHLLYPNPATSDRHLYPISEGLSPSRAIQGDLEMLLEELHDVQNILNAETHL